MGFPILLSVPDNITQGNVFTRIAAILGQISHIWHAQMPLVHAQGRGALCIRDVAIFPEYTPLGLLSAIYNRSALQPAALAGTHTHSTLV